MADMSEQGAREARGRWLREQRLRKFATGREFAAALGIDQSVVSEYETGKIGKVSDERAEEIAAVLELPVIEVRLNLGLWVPSEFDSERMAERTRQPDISAASDDDLVDELRRRLDRAPAPPRAIRAEKRAAAEQARPAEPQKPSRRR